jgi:DMSO reductase anchor subunit
LAILGLGLIYCMAQVYHLRAVPTWNSWRTYAAFFLSAVILGALGVNIAVPQPEWVILAGIGMATGMLMMLTTQSAIDDTAGKLRITFLSLGIIGAAFLAIVPQANQTWLAIPIFLVAMTAEMIGRWQFYAVRKPFPMRTNKARTDHMYRARSSRGRNTS